MLLHSWAQNHFLRGKLHYRNAGWLLATEETLLKKCTRELCMSPRRGRLSGSHFWKSSAELRTQNSCEPWLTMTSSSCRVCLLEVREFRSNQQGAQLKPARDFCRLKKTAWPSQKEISLNYFKCKLHGTSTDQLWSYRWPTGINVPQSGLYLHCLLVTPGTGLEVDTFFSYLFLSRYFSVWLIFVCLFVICYICV